VKRLTALLLAVTLTLSSETAPDMDALIFVALLAGAFAIGWKFVDFKIRTHEAEAKLDAIARLEVHGREFIDAGELYRILGEPIPDPIDHAATIRARHPNGA